MDRNNITKSILSITSPGTHLIPSNDASAAKCTRSANEELAAICRSSPSRFAFFASLPLPAVQESLAEIDYAFDTLGAVGVCLMTNAHGRYLGDSTLDPIFEALNERKAIVFMHPTTCQHPSHDIVEKPLNLYPSPMLEFFFDTTRAVANLLLSGTVERYSALTFVVPHGGAVIPPLLERVCSMASIILKRDDTPSSEKVKDLFRSRFYFDLAGFVFPDQIYGLLRVVGTERLVYGSDYPWTPERACERLVGRLERELEGMFDAKVVGDICSKNAADLLEGGREAVERVDEVGEMERKRSSVVDGKGYHEVAVTSVLAS